MVEAIGGLVERIVLTDGPAWGWMDATLHGELGTIIQWTMAGFRKSETDTLSVGTSVSLGAG